MIGFGIVGTLFAAVFGFTDYLTAPMSPEAKTTGTWHMLLNVIVLLVFAAAFFVRLPNSTAPLGYVLTAIGVVVLMISGMLGGHLACHYRVGVEESSTATRSETGSPLWRARRP